MQTKTLIKEALTKKEILDFVKFPYQLYRDHPCWIPQIIADEVGNITEGVNPAFEFCDAKFWVALQDGKIVGRVGGIINRRYNEKVGKQTSRFTCFDVVNDPEVATLLLQTVEAWARGKGATLIHGPFGFTDMDPEGMLVEGFDELGTIATLYNHPYYPQYMEQNGYQKEIDWVEYELILPREIPEKVDRIANTVLERYQLHLLKAKRAKQMLPYAHELFAVLNETYKDLHGFTPLTDKQIEKYTKQYFGFIIPDFVPIVLDKDNRLIAFGITMPSLARAFQKAKGRLFPFGFIHILRAMKKNNRAELFLTGVRPDYQDKGVNAILMSEMNKVFLKHGIEKVESNPELETNAKIQAQWRFYEKRQHKRRRCYVKQL